MDLKKIVLILSVFNVYADDGWEWLRFGVAYKELAEEQLIKERRDSMLIAGMRDVITTYDDSTCEGVMKKIHQGGISTDQDVTPGKQGKCPTPTTLTLALFLGKNKTAKCLIEQGGDVNRDTGSGYECLTPLAFAVKAGNLEGICLCLDAGASIKNGVHSTRELYEVRCNYDNIMRAEKKRSEVPIAGTELGANDKTKKWDEKLKIYHIIDGILTERMINNTLSEECPFSGTIR